MLTKASTNTDIHEDYLQPSSPGISRYMPNSDEWSVPQKLAQPTADSSNSEVEQIKRLSGRKRVKTKRLNSERKT